MVALINHLLTYVFIYIVAFDDYDIV